MGDLSFDMIGLPDVLVLLVTWRMEAVFEGRKAYTVALVPSAYMKEMRFRRLECSLMITQGKEWFVRCDERGLIIL